MPRFPLAVPLLAPYSLRPQWQRSSPPSRNLVTLSLGRWERLRFFLARRWAALHVAWLMMAGQSIGIHSSRGRGLAYRVPSPLVKLCVLLKCASPM